MKATQIPLFTEKENPSDAQVISHQLLVRAGFIKKQASGLYTYLPFGWTTHRTIEQIIREEMDAHKAVEVHLPVIIPAELWQKTGRWDAMGPEMMRLQDRHNNPFCLGPTHEESITDLALSYLRSYRQLPINFYQIGTKYRDEIRPRYGLIRCREFTMKDAYSFHIDDVSLDETYQTMRQCYRIIFERCGIDAIPVEADSGAMGGSGSEEFMCASDIGEATLLISEKNDYRGNQEKVEFFPATPYSITLSPIAKQEVLTPNLKTIEEVASFLKVSTKDLVKAVVYENEQAIVIGFIPGDRDVSEAKLQNVSGQALLELASPASIIDGLQSVPGFTGPIDLSVQHNSVVSVQNKKKVVLIYFDQYLKNRGNLIVAGNKKDVHYTNINEGRDFTAIHLVDLVLAKEGDLCPTDKTQTLTQTKGIELGHIFKLGKKYTQSLGVTVLDATGRPITPTMGCYGIGVGRTLQSIVEQNYDEKGIIWPESVSPYKFYFIGISNNETDSQKINELYTTFKKAGMNVYFDDRNERPGVKFNDADLVGFPWQIIAGKNFFNSSILELKNRKSGEKTEIHLDDLLLKFRTNP